MQSNILKMFDEKKRLHQNEEIEEEHQLSQEDLCLFLLAVNFEKGLIESTEHSNEMRKVINAVIKKMIKEERMLMVVEDSNDLTKRILQIHPNYVRS